jgi:hypothetical protein
MMETLKKYWYIAVGLVVLLYMMMKKKTKRRRRKNRRRMPMRSYSRMSYSRPMRRRSRR